MIDLLAEVRFQPRDRRQRRIDQTFRLDDVQTRRRTGIELRLGQRQRIATGLEVLAGDFQKLLIVARVNVIGRDVRNDRQPRHIGASVRGIERRIRAFFCPPILAKKIEQPGCGERPTGG
jgi:hypothetical protein